MMKIVCCILFLSTMPKVFARDCKVFGISDSPQKLSCNFKNRLIKLSCKRGVFYLNSDRVTRAYHLDVEFGSSPLVFKTNTMEMIAVINSKVDITAELTQRGRVTSLGTCY